jgi:hypothetical protein
MPALERTRERLVIINPDAPLLLTCTPVDPFGIDNRCPNNQTGHRFIGSCGDVVCVHCTKVVWS